MNKIRIKQYEQTADEKVSFNGIKWLRKWDVCVQCDSAEEAEALRARLAQPEPAECDGGQCGIGGYCKECPKPQQSWCKAMNGCDSKCEDCPDKPKPDYEAEFIKDWNEGKVRRVFDGKRMVPEREWVGLTREELAEIAEFHFHGALSAREFYDDIEAKLKEKNT